jgi:lipopolysaccharide/colanic/teichoic acid biosynthesis glycosyltransferase
LKSDFGTTMLTGNQQIVKRIFDISISIVILPFVIIPLVLLFVFATLDTGKNGLFVQKRIGRLGLPFNLYKIRSLKGEDHTDAVAIKQNETKFGSWLRRSKLDELPQFFNVLRGDMSLVGPRPDVAGYADLLKGEDRIILVVRPGITGPATLKYKDEDKLLLQQSDPKAYNDSVLWPDKVAINKDYVKNWSLQKDIGYLLASVKGVGSQ